MSTTRRSQRKRDKAEVTPITPTADALPKKRIKVEQPDSGAALGKRETRKEVPSKKFYSETKLNWKPSRVKEEKEEEKPHVKAGIAKHTTKVKKEPGTDLTEPDEYVCEYEKLRLQNLQDNAQFLARIGIAEAKENMVHAQPKKSKPTSRGLKEKKPPAEPLPRRSSLRLMNKDPEGKQLPELPIVPETAYEDEHPRKPAEPICMRSDVRNMDEEEQKLAHEKFLGSLSDLSQNQTKTTVSLERFTETVKKMKITEAGVAKVVPQRAFSIAIHPTTDKILACTGDKWGRLGFWDVESTEGQDGVFSYEPHSRPINCLNFNPFDSSQLLSCGYDGTLRCCDLNKAVFDLVYATPEDHDVRTNAFDFLDAHTVLVAQSDGTTAQVDLRTRNSEKPDQEWVTHTKSNRTVSIHPVQRHYFLSACYDGRAELWDLRKMAKKKPMSLDVLIHNKTLSSAYFSPCLGNSVVTTSMDDRLRLWDSSNVGTEIKIQHTIRHNNHTGRWLTKFRAVWHPARDDVFVVGSMDRPRRIELFSSEGKMIHHFMDFDYLNSVCSLSAFHPTLNVVVGTNSSGRLHVFK